MCIYTADGPQSERVKASVKAKIASSWQNVQSTSSQLVRHVLMHTKRQTHLIWNWKRFLLAYRLLLCHTLHSVQHCLWVRNYFKEVWECFWFFFWGFGHGFYQIYDNLLLRSGNTIQQFSDIILNSFPVSNYLGHKLSALICRVWGLGAIKMNTILFFLMPFLLEKCHDLWYDIKSTGE